MPYAPMLLLIGYALLLAGPIFVFAMDASSGRVNLGTLKAMAGMAASGAVVLIAVQIASTGA